jgi:hypothetical protein
MYHPQGFQDCKSIIIKNNNAYYYSDGSSYLDKFINNLTLEQKFKNEDEYKELCEIYKNPKNIQENAYVKTTKFSKMIYEDSNYNYKICKKRKGKFNKIKSKRVKFMKKNKIRQDGYDYKLFMTQPQNFNECENEEEVCDYYSIIEYDSYDEEEEMFLNCVEWVKDNCFWFH